MSEDWSGQVPPDPRRVTRPLQGQAPEAAAISGTLSAKLSRLSGELQLPENQELPIPELSAPEIDPFLATEVAYDVPVAEPALAPQGFWARVKAFLTREIPR